MLDLQEAPNAADTALQIADEQIKSAARRVTAFTVKHRARQFLKDSLRLEAIHHGLCCASPECLIRTGKTMLENERQFPTRNFGLGGYVPAMNAKALVVLGRYQRRMWAAIRKGGA